jgi:hypothetical protein
MMIGQWKLIIMFELRKWCSLSPTVFVIYIDKIEQCLEEECIVVNMVKLVFFFLCVYSNDIVLLAKTIDDLHNNSMFSINSTNIHDLIINIDKSII